MDGSVPIPGGEFANDALPAGLEDLSGAHGLFSTDWLGTHHPVAPGSHGDDALGDDAMVWVPLPGRQAASAAAPAEPGPFRAIDEPAPAAPQPEAPEDDDETPDRPRGPIRPGRRLLPSRQRLPRRR